MEGRFFGWRSTLNRSFFAGVSWSVEADDKRLDLVWEGNVWKQEVC